MYVRDYLQGSENGRVVTIDLLWHPLRLNAAILDFAGKLWNSTVRRVRDIMLVGYFFYN